MGAQGMGHLGGGSGEGAFRWGLRGGTFVCMCVCVCVVC